MDKVTLPVPHPGSAQPRPQIPVSLQQLITTYSLFFLFFFLREKNNNINLVWEPDPPQPYLISAPHSPREQRRCPARQTTCF